MLLCVFLPESFHCFLWWAWPAESSVHSGHQGKTWVQIAALPLSGCVTPGKLFNLSEWHFCKMRIMILTLKNCCEDQMRDCTWKARLTQECSKKDRRQLLLSVGYATGSFLAGSLCAFLGLPGIARTSEGKDCISPIRWVEGSVLGGDLCSSTLNFKLEARLEIFLDVAIRIKNWDTE